MKLFGKKEINLAKAKERQLEVEEGAKLATKVDALRKAKVTEEGNLTRFREGSLKIIREELTRLTDEKKALIDENKKLTKDREVLRTPLTREWDEVRQARAEFERDQAFMEHLLSENDQTLLRLQAWERDLEKSDDIIKNRDEHSQALQEKSAALLAEASHISAQAEHAKRISVKSIELAEQKLSLREDELLSKERDLNNYQDILQARDRQITVKEAQIRDRYQTLLRAEKYATRN